MSADCRCYELRQSWGDRSRISDERVDDFGFGSPPSHAPEKEHCNAARDFSSICEPLLARSHNRPMPHQEFALRDADDICLDASPYTYRLAGRARHTGRFHGDDGELSPAASAERPAAACPRRASIMLAGLKRARQSISRLY